MAQPIYEYLDYKTFLVDLINSSPKGGRGQRKLLADAMRCQVSYVTNVLSGSSHLSAEQAEAAARFFGLNQDEIEFFLLLLQYGRAGTDSLKKFTEKLMKEKKSKAQSLKSRLKMPDALKTEEETIYYSAWYYGAVHVLLSIPSLQTREALAEKLNLPMTKITEVLTFLEKVGLCEKKGQRYQIGRSQIHLDKNSPLITKHHANWRVKTLQLLESQNEDHLHYSSVLTISKKDFQKVFEILSKSLAESLKVITASPEEEAAVLCLDFCPL